MLRQELGLKAVPDQHFDSEVGDEKLNQPKSVNINAQRPGSAKGSRQGQNTSVTGHLLVTAKDIQGTPKSTKQIQKATGSNTTSKQDLKH